MTIAIADGATEISDTALTATKNAFDSALGKDRERWIILVSALIDCRHTIQSA